jgi:NitT/TauT family transport system ATP-binding protein
VCHGLLDEVSDISILDSVTMQGRDDLRVEVDRLTKAFGSSVAISDLSFTAHDREFVTLVGPSGCGKSTTLRLIAGLLKPSAGTVRVNQRDVCGPVGDASMVFQSPVLLPWRRMIDNILFTAEMRGQRRDTVRERAADLITLAGLEGFEHRYPHELSGGMQQRVAICRALLLKPTLLLMDEPFGALDVLTREHLAFQLQHIWATNRSTVLFVTHSITEAVLLSDTVIVFAARPGRIRSVVPVDLPRPRDTATLRDPRFLDLSAAIREQMESEWPE